MFVVTKEKGQVSTSGPLDVCKVPAPPSSPVPMPFPNVAMTAGANPVTKKVMINGMPALTIASKIQPSSGDEAGVAGGVVSGKIMGAVEFVMASKLVNFEGSPAVFMGNTTTQNDGNAVGADLMASQNVVTLGG